MKTRHFKNALLGIALALAAAYLYFIGFVVFFEGARGWRIAATLIPLLAVFYTSWAVIPIGAALGMLIPRLAAGKSRGTAALHGALFGAGAGLVTGICLTSVFGFVWGTSPLILSMAVYSALWVGAYAFCRAQGESIYR